MPKKLLQVCLYHVPGLRS